MSMSRDFASRHDVELMLDGDRVQLFTVSPPPAGKDHSLVDKDLNIRIPVKAGPHVLAVAFPKKAAPLARNRAPALARALQYGPASSHPAGFVLDLGQWSLRSERRWGHAQPPADFVVACKAGEKTPAPSVFCRP